MAYTEVKEKNRKKYYYRVLSVREGKKVSKKRRYLGVNLEEDSLKKAEEMADKELIKDKIIKIDKNIGDIKTKIILILKKNKVKKAGIFGSYVSGMQKKNSDIDMLIEPPKGMGLKFFRLERELSEKLGKRVDLLTYNGIYRPLRKRILTEEVRIL